MTSTWSKSSYIIAFYQNCCLYDGYIIYCIYIEMYDFNLIQMSNIKFFLVAKLHHFIKTKIIERNQSIIQFSFCYHNSKFSLQNGFNDIHKKQEDQEIKVLNAVNYKLSQMIFSFQKYLKIFCLDNCCKCKAIKNFKI